MTEAAIHEYRVRRSAFWSSPDASVDVSTWSRRAAWFVAAVTSFRLLIISTTGLSNTESYYYAWSRFPDWSYYDHPPLVAWLTALTTFGSHSTISARFGFVACSAILGGLVYRLAARMFTPRAGFIALVAVTIPPVFFINGFLINPEGPLAPLWVFALLLLDDLRRHDEPWRPLLLGLVIGTAFLAKYTAILLVPVALIVVASSATARPWLRRPSFYAGGLVALAMASPVILWNYERHWPTVRLHLVERVSSIGQAPLWIHAARMAFSQFILMQPLVLPGFLVMLVIAIRRAKEDERYRLLAISGGLVLLFIYAVMVRVADAEPHWAMVGYLPLAIAAGGWLDEKVDRPPRWLDWYTRACIAISGAFVVVYFLHSQTPAVLRLVPSSMYSASVDPINETLGWDRIRTAIQGEAASLGPDTVVVSNHNVLCGQLATQLDDRPRVFCPSPRRTAFDFFGRRDPPAGAPVVYVDSARYQENVSELLPGRRCVRVQTIDVTRDGRSVAAYGLYACPGA
jgi:4-amino-4-deoxy-L-arabinose transferase-like glycosyltransferase